jgi:hypothetical protein
MSWAINPSPTAAAKIKQIKKNKLNYVDDVNINIKVMGTPIIYFFKKNNSIIYPWNLEPKRKIILNFDNYIFK